MHSFSVEITTILKTVYHGKGDDPVQHPELPDLCLAFESMSPAQRYSSLESARNTIPDWKTMSILKRHYYPDQAKVGKYGIRFQNVYYFDEALTEIPNKWVSYPMPFVYPFLCTGFYYRFV